MAELEPFKFPDEQDNDQNNVDIDIDTSAETDVEIQIEDDTPERDRKAKPLDREVEDPTDEEIESYSKAFNHESKS